MSAYSPIEVKPRRPRDLGPVERPRVVATERVRSSTRSASLACASAFIALDPRAGRSRVQSRDRVRACIRCVIVASGIEEHERQIHACSDSVGLLRPAGGALLGVPRSRAAPPPATRLDDLGVNASRVLGELVETASE